MDVSENSGTPKSSTVFHYKPYILGYPYFLETPIFWWGTRILTLTTPFFHAITASYTPLKGPKARTCRAANSSEMNQPPVVQVRAVSVILRTKITQLISLILLLGLDP